MGKPSPAREALIGKLLARVAEHRPAEVTLIIAWAFGQLVDAEPDLYEPLMAILSSGPSQASTAATDSTSSSA